MDTKNREDRRYLKKVLGLSDKRIKHLKNVLNMSNADKIKYYNDFVFADYLFTDEPFGILTRPALELIMQKAGGTATLYIVDFKDIHKLNSQLGYLQVNNMIRRIIADFCYKFKDDSCGGLILGRVFSGDEIAIIDDVQHTNLMSVFSKYCKKYKLGFKWAEGTITLGLSLEEHKKQLDKLSQKLQSSLYSKVL
jgi:hypothetical protein